MACGGKSTGGKKPPKKWEESSPSAIHVVALEKDAPAQEELWQKV